MSHPRCLFTVIDVPLELCERALREVVTPIVRVLRSRPELDSLFFVRFAEPAWQLRFRVLGNPDWIDDYVRPLLTGPLASLKAEGTIQGYAFGIYGREVERYGGEVGMRLTEMIYHHDSLACLDLIDAEAQGLLSRTRREYSLVFVEKILDLMRFDRDRRLAFYERGYRWAVDDGTLRPEDFRALDQRYETLKAGLVELLRGAGSRDDEAQWGGVEPARIAGACLAATRPLMEEALEARAEGRLTQDLVELAWSWTHLHTNRLGVVSVSEAVLRYFMSRLYREGAVAPA